MWVAQFMQPNYICAALSGHAHVCAYKQVKLVLIRSLNGAYPNCLRKKVYMQSTMCKLSADNHVVISEHRKSCYLKNPAQSDQKMDFRNITHKTLLLISCFMMEAYTIGLLCSAHVALVLWNVWCKGRVQKQVCAPLSENMFRTAVFWLPYNLSVQRYVSEMALSEKILLVTIKSDCTDNLIRINISLYPYACVNAYTNQSLQQTVKCNEHLLKIASI